MTWLSRRATAPGSHSETGMLTAATMPTNAPACPASYPLSRQSWENHPKIEYACIDWSPKTRTMAQPIRVRATSANEMLRVTRSR